MRDRPARALRMVVAALALVVVSASAALAAVPTNDDRADATVISNVPFSDTTDVALATTEEDEPQNCGLEDNPTVWYRYTATADDTLVATTAGSTYRAAVAVYEGSLSSMVQVACDWTGASSQRTAVDFHAIEGRTYYIQVGHIGFDEGTLLQFALRPGIEISNQIDDTGWVHAGDGSATVTGTLGCSSPISVRIRIRVAQPRPNGVQRFSFNDTTVDCQSSKRWQLAATASTPFTTENLRVLVATKVQTEGVDHRQLVYLTGVLCGEIATVGDDVMSGTSGRDRLCALSGSDVIDGQGGDDAIFAGPGNDRVSARGGTDVVSGGKGSDTIELGKGPDVASGGRGGDRVFGQYGADTLSGNGGPDVLAGGSGSDTCTGGPGRDGFRSCERKR